MNILALDLSKASTGYAVWAEGEAMPIYGHWVLGSEFTSQGRVFMKLHQNMSDLHRVVCRFEHVFIEAPIHPAQLQGGTNMNSLRLASGLAAHAHSFADAMGCRSIQEVNVESWRPDFIGRMATSDAKSAARRAKKEGDKRASARGTLKAMTMERCRQLGFKPKRDDEADALGILDYACTLRGVIPPWRAGEVLRPMLGGERV